MAVTFVGVYTGGFSRSLLSGVASELLPSRRAGERVFDLRLRPRLVALNFRACPDLLLPLTASPDPLPSPSWKFSV